MINNYHKMPDGTLMKGEREPIWNIKPKSAQQVTRAGMRLNMGFAFLPFVKVKKIRRRQY